MIYLKNPQTGVVKECPLGFSVTTLLFGCFVPLARGWYGYAFVTFLVACFTFGISWLIVPFIINKSYAKFLLERGYLPTRMQDIEILREMEIAFDPPEDLLKRIEKNELKNVA